MAESESCAKAFLLHIFSLKLFTFSYLLLTVTGLPTYYNRSTGLKSKTVEKGLGIKMFEQNKIKSKTKHQTAFKLKQKKGAFQ